MPGGGVPDAASAYLDLVQKALLNSFQPENGARIKLLLDMAVKGGPPQDRNALLKRLVDIGREKDVVAALSDLYRPRHWWTKVLGFPFSMVGEKRLSNARFAADTVIAEGIRGDFAETGVWRGGCCIMMKAVAKIRREPRRIYVCDSFQGLPDEQEGPDANLTLNENPILSVPLEDVKAHFERFDLLDDTVHFVKGWFCDTLPELSRDGPEALAVLRLDGDYYTSTMDALTSLYPLVSPGGFVIIDDYGAYEQCRQAVHEYRDANGISAEIVDIDGLGAWWRKPLW